MKDKQPVFVMPVLEIKATKKRCDYDCPYLGSGLCELFNVALKGVGGSCKRCKACLAAEETLKEYEFGLER